MNNQQVTKTNNQTGVTLPPVSKATNKTVTPINDTGFSAQVVPPGAVGGGPIYDNKGLLGAATNSYVKTDYKPAEYKSDGYTGVQGKTDYSYTPSENSLVENRITGLLDPNSAMMRKAVAQSQNFMASRGLQSSSIANESALSSMIDKALPIASQDASTYGNADQTGWNNSFTAEQNNLSRTHDASMFDKNGRLQVDMQNNEFGFQNTQNNANRESNVLLENLQQQNRLGLLDEEGKQRLAELEKEAELTKIRDEKLQQYNKDNFATENEARLTEIEKEAELNAKRDEQIQKYNLQNADTQYLRDLETTRVKYEREDSNFEKEVDAQNATNYKAATANAYDNYMTQVSAIYNNPEMTAAQQSAGVKKLQEMYEAQRVQLQAIYGYASETVDTSTPVSNGQTTMPDTEQPGQAENPRTPPSTTKPFMPPKYDTNFSREDYR
jgi:hypothetical protein